MSTRFISAFALSLALAGCASAPEQMLNNQPGSDSGAPGASSRSESAAPLPRVSGANAEAFEASVTALQSGDLATAETLLRRITADQPELAGPWINLGQVYVQKGELEEARLAFRQAIAANPDNCAAYNQLGVLSRQAGDFEAAESHYRACLARVPNYQDVYLNLGILYELYLGRLDEALAAYRQYQSLRDEPDRQVAGWVMDLERRLGV